MSRGRLAAASAAAPWFCGKTHLNRNSREEENIPALYSAARRGSGICDDRHVQFVFHTRFQHIFVDGKTAKYDFLPRLLLVCVLFFALILLIHLAFDQMLLAPARRGPVYFAAVSQSW